MDIYDQKGSVDVLSENQSVRQEETRIEAKKKITDENAVAELVKKSNRILVSISSHRFPLDPFPDTLNIEEGRITVINRRMLDSEVHSVDIKDISNVFINKVVFFSQLAIISKTFEENEIRIANLRTKEAIYARRIIEGLRVFVNKKIDTSDYSTKELLAKLQQLSTTEIVT